MRINLRHIVMCTMLVTVSCAPQKNVMAKDAKLVLVSNNFEFTEGPASDKEGNVYFTDQPNDRIMKWVVENNSIEEYIKPAGRSNGLFLDIEGNLLSAADESNQLWRIGPDKKVTVLASEFEGKRFNGPNDIWIDSKGGIYFTDPYYQRDWWEHSQDPQPSRRVYYLDGQTKKLRIVADDNFGQPNGIIGSPDGRKLYVADQSKERTYVYDISATGDLINKKIFANMGSDGMTTDYLGNVYLTGQGVTVLNDEGEKITHIKVPEEWTSNVTFGGKQQHTLFITAMKSIYTLEMTVHGVRWKNQMKQK